MNVVADSPLQLAAWTQTGGPLTALRQRHEAGPLVIFIVAAALLLAFGMALAAAVAYFCITKGGSLEWWTRNGWKVWEIKIACRMR